MYRCVCVQRQSDVVLVKQQLDLEFNAFANIARYLLCVFFFVFVFLAFLFWGLFEHMLCILFALSWYRDLCF